MTAKAFARFVFISIQFVNVYNAKSNHFRSNSNSNDYNEKTIGTYCIYISSSTLQVLYMIKMVFTSATHFVAHRTAVFYEQWTPATISKLNYILLSSPKGSPTDCEIDPVRQTPLKFEFDMGRRYGVCWTALLLHWYFVHSNLFTFKPLNRCIIKSFDIKII